MKNTKLDRGKIQGKLILKIENCCKKQIREKNKREKSRERKSIVEWRGSGMCARAWHKDTPPAARPSMGSCISNKRRLKALFCKNSVRGLLKFTKN